MMHDFPYTDLHELNIDWFLGQFKNLKKLVEDLKKIVINAPDATSATAGQAPIADGQGGWQWGRPTAVNVPVSGFYNNETEELVFENVNGTELFGIDVSALDGGGSITVDSALSDTSENPVQNKVIKSALDNKASTATATTTMAGLMSATDKSNLETLYADYLSASTALG